MNGFVTINTDASCAQTEKLGAYAFWIVTDEGKIQKAGELKGEVVNSDHAELQSICNAIYTFKHSKFRDIKKVVINTDSQCSIDFLSQKGASKKPHIIKVLKEIRFLMMECCLKYGFSIRDVDTFFNFKHVKAHNGKKDTRSFVNDWCDKQVKKYLRQLVNKQ